MAPVGNAVHRPAFCIHGVRRARRGHLANRFQLGMLRLAERPSTWPAKTISFRAMIRQMPCEDSVCWTEAALASYPVTDGAPILRPRLLSRTLARLSFP